jgi:hypothetical protein
MDKVTKIMFVFVIFAALVQSQDINSIRLVGIVFAFGQTAKLSPKA